MILTDCKQSYKNFADAVLPEWEQMTKSELCNLHVNSESENIKQAVIAALVCKCWNIFIHNYRQQPYIPIEDWYESMLEAIMYVLDKHVWTKEDSILYNNEKGPEIALHRCIWSRKMNVFYQYNRPKHLANKNPESIEKLSETGFDVQCTLNEDEVFFRDYIKMLFNNGKSCFAIISDLINHGIPREKLALEITKLTEAYSAYFYRKYGIPEKAVTVLVEQLKRKRNLAKYIQYYITCMERDQDLLNYLRS